MFNGLLRGGLIDLGGSHALEMKLRGLAESNKAHLVGIIQKCQEEFTTLLNIV
jgi:hypothetical protein